MGAYITQADIESVFGVSNVARWSQLDPDTTGADTSRIAAAIAYAEETVQDRLRGGLYAVPFVASGSSFPASLKTWIAQIAGSWLYKSRGMLDSPSGEEQDRNRITVQERDAMRGINAVLAGQRSLELQRATASGPAGTPVSVPGFVSSGD